MCQAVPAEMNCEENLPDFWAAIAVNLFNPDNGFFASNNLCMVSLDILLAVAPLEASSLLFIALVPNVW